MEGPSPGDGRPEGRYPPPRLRTEGPAGRVQNRGLPDVYGIARSHEWRDRHDRLQAFPRHGRAVASARSAAAASTDAAEPRFSARDGLRGEPRAGARWRGSGRRTAGSAARRKAPARSGRGKGRPERSLSLRKREEIQALSRPVTASGKGPESEFTSE